MATLILLSDLGLCGAKAHAQNQYVLDTAHGTTPSGATQTSDGHQTADTFANGTYTGQAGGLTASCQGTMTFNYVWSSSGPKPASIIVAMATSANYSGLSGACDDGNGDATTTHTYSDHTTGVSSGIKYQVINAPGNSFSVTITPSASAVKAPAVAANCTVAVTVTVTNVVVTFDNVIDGTPYGKSRNEALPGQYETATVSAGSYTLRDDQWAFTLPNLAIKKMAVWYTGAPYYTVHDWQDLGDSDYQNTSVRFLIMNGPAADAKPFLLAATFTGTAYDSANHRVGDVVGKEIVNVVGPDNILLLDDLTNETSTLSPDYIDPNIMASKNLSHGAPGMEFGFYVRTPAEFSATIGNGSAALGQLVNLQYVVNDATTLTTNGTTMLDTKFPIIDASVATTGMLEQFTGDSPQVAPLVGAFDAISSATFEIYLAYKPPSVVIGGSDFVPTKASGWTWNCSSHWTGDDLAWTQPTGNATQVSGPDLYPWSSFRWTQILTANHGVIGLNLGLDPYFESLEFPGPRSTFILNKAMGVDRLASFHYVPYSGGHR